MNAVTVVGAGLAGSEAAYQLAVRGIPVRLIEMKPKKMTPAHVSPYFAELVCSNSLRSDELTNAVGLLKEELRRLGSVVMRCADEHRVAAGGALAVDREGFARAVTEAVRALPNVEIVEEEAVDIPDGEVIIASGPPMRSRRTSSGAPAAKGCTSMTPSRRSYRWIPSIWKAPSAPPGTIKERRIM